MMSRSELIDSVPVLLDEEATREVLQTQLSAQGDYDAQCTVLVSLVNHNLHVPIQLSLDAFTTMLFFVWKNGAPPTAQSESETVLVVGSSVHRMSQMTVCDPSSRPAARICRTGTAATVCVSTEVIWSSLQQL